MTFEERVRQVQAFGMTARQAGFMVNVMLHSGVFVRRQYCAWAGLTHGEKVHQFIRLLDRRRVATSQPCGHGRGRVYHVHYKPLYRAIGERDTRLRRPAQLARAVERLMLLDGVLLDRSLAWLGSERDKVHHFTVRMGVPRDLLPHARFGRGESPTTRYFAERLPIGVDAADHHHAFLFLATRSETGRFRLFLERYAELLRLLPSWSIRVLVPRHVTDAQRPYRLAFAEHLTQPLPPESSSELQWYFEARRRSGIDRDERFFDAQVGFSRPRFHALFQVWLEQGDRVLDAATSPVLRDAVARANGSLEVIVLPHPYLHLLPLVGTA